MNYMFFRFFCVGSFFCIFFKGDDGFGRHVQTGQIVPFQTFISNLLTRRPSARQQANWVPWPKIREATAQLIAELETDSVRLAPLKLYL